jgi:carbonic anhydrase
MISAEDAIERLRAGNRRFATEESNLEQSVAHARRAELVAGQNPFAIILACSDSRVPVELVFDQGIGDLFVIRVAGNVVAPSQVGSVEFAAAQLGTRLVVVLGHSNCGAVEATLKEMRREAAHRSPNLRAIVDRIQPAIEPLLEQDADLPLQDAVVANVHSSVERLRHGSIIIEELIASGDLCIVGAAYSMENGQVTFLDAR